MTKIHKVLTILLCVALWQHSANAQTGNVGVGNNTPVAKLDVAGDLALREGTAIAVSGVNPTVPISLHATNAENSFYRITGSPTGTMALNTIANGVDGQIITLVNATTIKLKISNTNSAGGILTSGGAATLIAPNGSVTLQYSTTASRWYVTNAAGATITDWTKATTADEPATKIDNQYVTGSVGIGDFSGADPSAKFHIYNGVGSKLSSTNVGDAIAVFDGGSGTANSRVVIGSNWTGSGTRPESKLEFWNNAFGGGQGNSATISTSSSQGSVTGQVNGNLLFSTANNATTPTERMRITNAGNVGIGTPSPYTNLDVLGNIYSSKHGNNNLHDISEQGSTYIGMKSGNTGDGFTGMKLQVGAYGSGGINNGSRIAFQTWGNTISTSRDVMTINEYGNVGINDNNPNNKLKVNGWVTVGNQSATGVAETGAMRYNTTRKCMEYYDGTYWICMEPPTVQRVTVRDQNDENYRGTGCNSCSGWGGSYGNIYNFTVNNLYAGQKIMFFAEVMFDNDTKKNDGFLNATKIYGNGYWAEDEVVVPGGWETVQTKVFPAQTITSTGNLTFSFESNTGITDVRITAVAY